MARYNPPGQGSVNIGVPIIKGKESPDPHGQELTLNPEQFVMQKGTPSPAKARVHERIKELIGESNIPRREAVKIAMAEAKESKHGDTGTISKKDIYRYKFQAEQPGREMSPFRSQEQEFPFI